MHLIKIVLVLAGLASSALASSSTSETAGGLPIKIDFSVLKDSSTNSATEGEAARHVKRAGSEILELEHKNTFYLATLKIGSDEQENRVIIDTGSADLWVMSKNVKCAKKDRKKRELDAISELYGSRRRVSASPTVHKNGKRDSNEINSPDPNASATKTSEAQTNICTSGGSFDTGLSESYKLRSNAFPFLISYADKSYAYGSWGSDNVAFGNAKMTDLTFGVANEADLKYGVLGLGIEELEITNTGTGFRRTYTYQNFPSKLKSDGYINKVVYSLYLDAEDALTGSILFGAVDHSKYSGTLQTVPLINHVPEKFKNPSEFYVMANLDGVKSPSKDVSYTHKPLLALLDSGTTFTYFPEDVLKSVASLLDATLTPNGFYMLSCNYGNDSSYLTYDFSGVKIKVPISNYILRVRGSCYLAMNKTPDFDDIEAPHAIFGHNTLRSAYIVYDLEDYEAAFAQVEFTTEENIEIVTKAIPLAVQAPGYSSTAFSESTGSSLAFSNPSLLRRSSGTSIHEYFTKSVIFGVIGICGIFLL